MGTCCCVDCEDDGSGKCRGHPGLAQSGTRAGRDVVGSDRGEFVCSSVAALRRFMSNGSRERWTCPDFVEE